MLQNRLLTTPHKNGILSRKGWNKYLKSQEKSVKNKIFYHKMKKKK